MDIVIITGMSGAGKTSVLNICQDNNYYSIDNIPPKLINEYFNIIDENKLNYNKFAFVIDIRVGYLLGDLEDEVKKLKDLGHNVKVIFLDASDAELIKRFKEKRRPHPYFDITLSNAIKKEREKLSIIREISDIYIETTGINLSQLNNKVLMAIDETKKPKIQIISFGYKYGNLKEADYQFDVRFINNPFYVDELKNQSGLDKNVSDYVLSFDISNEFIKKVNDLIESVMPHFIEQSKNNLVIGIGCTGGKHRSVSIAEELKKNLEKRYDTKTYHREQDKW